MISVIVPIYNADKYINNCVKSILNQSYNDYEIILVNDGSTDQSGQICDELQAQNSKIKVIHQANGGVSASRNLGIQNAKGEFIMFLDADDELAPDAMDLLFRLQKQQNADFVCGSFRVVRLIGGSDFLFGDKVWIGKEIAVHYKDVVSKINSVWGKLFRRNIIIENNLRFDKDVKCGEDSIFALNYVEVSESIVCTNQVVYFYNRKNMSTALHKYYDDYWLYWLKINEAARQMMKKYCRDGDVEWQIKMENYLLDMAIDNSLYHYIIRIGSTSSAIERIEKYHKELLMYCSWEYIKNCSCMNGELAQLMEKKDYIGFVNKWKHIHWKLCAKNWFMRIIGRLL